MVPPDEALVDIHCHLLPGVDDGAADWETTLAMARQAVTQRIATVIATPHQLGRYGGNDGETIRRLVGQVQGKLDAEGIPLRVLAGADVRIEAGMVDRLRRGEVLSLGDFRRHILLELPHDLYLPIERLLDDLRREGVTGILSHPERNGGILERPAIVERLVARGCLMQVTAASLTGHFGRSVRRLTERLIGEGLVHLVASDAHDPSRRPFLLREAFGIVTERAGLARAVELFCRNPAAVAAGRPVVVARHGAAAGRGLLRRWFARAS